MSFQYFFKKMKLFWLAVAFFGLLFALLLSIRLNLLNHVFSNSTNTLISFKHPPVESDSYMNIFQNGRKIGFSHTTLSKKDEGYSLKEILYIRINTMGMVQDVNLKTHGRLNLDYTLASFDFEIGSGRFRFSARGAVSGDVLSIKTRSFDSTQKIDIRIKDKIYVAAGIMNAIKYIELESGKEFTFQVFDPVSMSQEPIHVEVIGKEEILNMGIKKNTKKLAIMFKGTKQMVWIGEGDEIIKEEGILGISLEKATRESALFGLPVESSQDLTKIASIPSNVNIEDAIQLKRLEVEITGIKYEDLNLDGGRQRIRNNILVIRKESLRDLLNHSDIKTSPDIEKNFLKPTPFVQSDHPKIKKLVQKIISYEDKPLDKANKLVEWINKNIEKRPVLSLPDALSTLENRMGDCNEHAVLLAALSRASGIPAKVEAGVVYLNGRFYYHAWNLLYLGRWITIDSLFGQIPADVTHIRLTSGAQSQQLDLMNVIGKIKLRVVKQTK